MIDDPSQNLPSPPDTDFPLKAGWIASFSGLATLTFSEKLSVKKLFQLSILILILPTLLFIILSSPLVNFEKNSRNSALNKFQDQVNNPSNGQSSFESFIAPENAGPTPDELMLRKKVDAEEAFDLKLSSRQKSKAQFFFYFAYQFYLLLGVPLICVILSGGISRDDIRNDTLPFFLCRPITRFQFMTIRLIIQTIWLEILLGIQTSLIIITGIVTQTPWISETIPYVLLIQILSIPTWCAIGIFMGLINKNYLIISIIYGVIVEIGIASIPSNIKLISMITHIKAILGQAQLTLALRPDWDIPLHFAASTIPLVIGFICFTTLAALTFHFKEMLPSKEAEK